MATTLTVRLHTCNVKYVSLKHMQEPGVGLDRKCRRGFAMLVVIIDQIIQDILGRIFQWSSNIQLQSYWSVGKYDRYGFFQMNPLKWEENAKNKQPSSLNKTTSAPREVWQRTAHVGASSEWSPKCWLKTSCSHKLQSTPEFVPSDEVLHIPTYFRSLHTAGPARLKPGPM